MALLSVRGEGLRKVMPSFQHTHEVVHGEFVGDIADDGRVCVGEAIGDMIRNADGVQWIGTVVLQPQIIYGARGATAAEEARLHELAHERCFIANSVKTRIVLRPSLAPSSATR